MRPNAHHVKHEGMSKLLSESWDADPDKRPSFNEIVKILSGFAKDPNGQERKSCRVQ